MQFFKATQNDARASSADRMPEGDRAAVDVEFFNGDVTKGALPS
jgi:hypothetical protein